ISLSIYFLNINGYDYCTSNFIEVMENYVVWVADNKIGKELLLEIITSLINDVSLSNSIKLKVINALNDDQEK
ncbi:MAG: type II toxin-antitoxin system death-on-curing family toxin, partial [Trichococcus flocculiformis]